MGHDGETRDDDVRRDDDSATKYATGSFVAVAYDHDLYMGEISDLGEDDCVVRFMVHVSDERFEFESDQTKKIRTNP